MPQHLNWNWQLQRTCTLGMMSTCGYTNLCILWRCCALFALMNPKQPNERTSAPRCPYNFGACWATGKLPSYFLKRWGPWAATSAGHRHGKCKIERISSRAKWSNLRPAVFPILFWPAFLLSFSQHKSFYGNRNQLTNSRGYGDLKNQTTWTVQLKQVPCHLRWWRLSM